MSNARRHSAVLLATGLLLPALAAPATILRTEAAHDDGRYTVSFEVVLDAARDKVWQIMTDYENLPRCPRPLSRAILKRSTVRASRKYHVPCLHPDFLQDHEKGRRH
jgi:hypothetical protein